MPQGEFVCQFLSGRCQISGKQWILRGIGTAKITAVDTANVVPETFSEINRPFPEFIPFI